MLESVRHLVTPNIAVALGYTQFKGRRLTRAASFGRNTNVGSSAFEPIATDGILNFLQAPDTMRIKAGGNVADDAAGTGAREILLRGIAVVDGNVRFAAETLITAGASASAPTALSWWRVFRSIVTGVGTYGGVNTGIITIENVNTPTDQLILPAGVGQSKTTLFSTPDDQQLLVEKFIFSVDVAQAAEINIVTRENFTTVAAPMSPTRIRATTEISSNAITVETSAILIIPPLTDIWIEAKATASSAVVSALMNGKLAAI